MRVADNTKKEEPKSLWGKVGNFFSKTKTGRLLKLGAIGALAGACAYFTWQIRAGISAVVLVGGLAVGGGVTCLTLGMGREVGGKIMLGTFKAIGGIWFPEITFLKNLYSCVRDFGKEAYDKIKNRRNKNNETSKAEDKDKKIDEVNKDKVINKSDKDVNKEVAKNNSKNSMVIPVISANKNTVTDRKRVRETMKAAKTTTQEISQISTKTGSKKKSVQR